MKKVKPVLGPLFTIGAWATDTSPPSARAPIDARASTASETPRRSVEETSTRRRFHDAASTKLRHCRCSSIDERPSGKWPWCYPNRGPAKQSGPRTDFSFSRRTWLLIGRLEVRKLALVHLPGLGQLALLGRDGAAQLADLSLLGADRRLGVRDGRLVVGDLARGGLDRVVGVLF